MTERFVPSEKDIGVMKAGITICFAEEYNKSLRETVELFQANGIFEYLDKFADQFINKTFPYMASFISDRLAASEST